MKKLFVIIFLSLVSLTCMKDLHAQPSAGIAVGTGWSRLSGTETGHENDFSLGLTCKFRLPLGFALQPYLMYQTRNTVPIATGQGDTFDFRQSSIELPVSLQWGPDLLMSI